MGFTPDLVVGTYIGFDTPRNMGSKETGGRVAIQGFIRFMEQAMKDQPVTEFRIPEDVRKIPVNRYSGQPLFEGEDALKNKNLFRKFVETKSVKQLKQL